jgi:hypothetical protein
MSVERDPSFQGQTDRASADDSDATQSARDAHATDGGPAAIGRLERQLEELGELLSFYVSARFDAIKASLMRNAVLAGAALVAVVAVAALLGGCLAIGILGLAQLVAGALGDRVWAGYVIIGFGLPLACGLAGWAALVIFSRRQAERTRHKYARRRDEQKTRFGRDVQERADSRQRRGD